jgi:uncharacterized protein DUF4282
MGVLNRAAASTQPLCGFFPHLQLAWIKENLMAGYFSFHKMVSTSIIKATYAIGLVLITLWGLAAIGLGIASLAQPDNIDLRVIVAGQPVGAILLGAIAVVFGNLLWRLLCESWILLFSMHELLAAIAHSSGESLPHVGYQRTLT